MFATARGALRQPHDSRFVEDADPYSVGADSISARESFRCRELAREADARPCILSIAKFFIIIRRKLCPKF
jgi:hypothetical protein